MPQVKKLQQKKCVLGIDIGGTGVSYALFAVDADGKVADKPIAGTKGEVETAKGIEESKAQIGDVINAAKQAAEKSICAD